MSDHVSVTPVTIGTHRLWISLWTPLGWPADNVGGPGGNGAENGWGATPVHSPSPARHRPRTGPVVTGTGRRLDYRPLSPASTVPTTATFFFSSSAQNPSRHPAARPWHRAHRAHHLATARHRPALASQPRPAVPDLE